MAELSNLFPTEEQKLAAARELAAEGLVVHYRWQQMLEIKTSFGLPLHLHHGYGGASGSIMLGSFCCGTTMTPYHFEEVSAAYCHSCQRLEEILRRETCSVLLDKLPETLSRWLSYYLPPLEAELVAVELQSLIWLLHDQELPTATARVEALEPRTDYATRVSYE